jgi:hypothetical protein
MQEYKLFFFTFGLCLALAGLISEDELKATVEGRVVILM